MTDNCGWPTANDTACKHPPTEDNGRCWLHADDADDIGRPTKFTDERAQAAIEAARQSKSETGCARAAEVTWPTLNRWLEDNPTFETASGERVEFRSAFGRARRDGETVLVQGGLRNDDIDTSMAKFLLATSFDYVKTEEVQHSAGDEATEITITREVVNNADDD